MQCLKCKKTKLSKEFPPFTLNENCDHAPLHCLRCATSYAKDTNRCSQCDLQVEDYQLRMCHLELQTLFPEVMPPSPDKGAKSGKLYVKRLDGMTMGTEYKASMSIHELKVEVSKKMNVKVEKQRLLFKGTQLMDTVDEEKPALLSDFGIQEGDTIHLLILLYAIPPNLTKVVFDLSFGWPDKGKDYLDASALLFSKKTYEGAADFWTLGFPPKMKKEDQAIYHSGDRQDKVRKQGKHLIKVNLSLVPKQITHVFFTLSSYKAPEISHFKNPTLRFYDESKPEKELIPDLIKKAGENQAIVMCSLVKMANQWFVHDNGAISSGNVKDYDPLKKTILDIIDETY